jgi:hypothetical protein
VATNKGGSAWSCFISAPGKEQFVALSLMIAFAVIVGAELVQRPGQRLLTEQNQLCQALLLDRPHPTFGKGIQIRTSGRKRECFHSALRQH